MSHFKTWQDKARLSAVISGVILVSLGFKGMSRGRRHDGRGEPRSPSSSPTPTVRYIHCNPSKSAGPEGQIEIAVKVAWSSTARGWGYSISSGDNDTSFSPGKINKNPSNNSKRKFQHFSCDKENCLWQFRSPSDKRKSKLSTKAFLTLESVAGQLLPRGLSCSWDKWLDQHQNTVCVCVWNVKMIITGNRKTIPFNYIV